MIARPLFACSSCLKQAHGSFLIGHNFSQYPPDWAEVTLNFPQYPPDWAEVTLKPPEKLGLENATFHLCSPVCMTKLMSKLHAACEQLYPDKPAKPAKPAKKTTTRVPKKSTKASSKRAKK